MARMSGWRRIGLGLTIIIIVGSLIIASPAAAADGPFEVNQDSVDLTFTVAFFVGIASYRVEVGEILIETRDSSGTWQTVGTTAITNGNATVNLDTSQTAYLSFSSDTFGTFSRRIQVTFTDGIMKVFRWRDATFDYNEIVYYLRPDGSYSFNYDEGILWVTNQVETTAPLMGPSFLKTDAGLISTTGGGLLDLNYSDLNIGFPAGTVRFDNWFNIRGGFMGYARFNNLLTGADGVATFDGTTVDPTAGELVATIIRGGSCIDISTAAATFAATSNPEVVDVQFEVMVDKPDATACGTVIEYGYRADNGYTPVGWVHFE